MAGITIEQQQNLEELIELAEENSEKKYIEEDEEEGNWEIDIEEEGEGEEIEEYFVDEEVINDKFKLGDTIIMHTTFMSTAKGFICNHLYEHETTVTISSCPNPSRKIHTFVSADNIDNIPIKHCRLLLVEKS